MDMLLRGDAWGFDRIPARGAGIRRIRTWALAALALLASGAEAQAQRGRAIFEVDAGVIGSSPLVKDDVPNSRDPEVLDLRDRVSGVRARIGPAPFVGATVRQPMSRAASLELRGAWTFGELQADDADGWRSVEHVGILHGTGSYRHAIGSRFAARGGIGVIRYGRTEAAILREQPKLRPLLEFGADAGLGVGGMRLELGAFLQAHGFGNPEIRAAGGVDGAVLRLGLGAGLLFGGTP